MALLKPEKYVRRTFEVEAIAVTPDNIQEVAEWCGGTIENEPYADGKGGMLTEEYVRVPVRNPNSERQTRAYYDDWVLLGGMEDRPVGFKVYTPRAFESSFEKQVDRMFEVVERMDKRAAREEREEEQEETLEFLDLPPVPSHVNPLQPFQQH